MHDVDTVWFACMAASAASAAVRMRDRDRARSYCRCSHCKRGPRRVMELAARPTAIWTVAMAPITIAGTTPFPAAFSVATARGSFHLSPVPCKVDQKRCQTCLFLLIGMLACLCPNPSIKFGSRKIVLQRILAGQAACSLVSGQFNDEKFNSDII